MTGRSPSISPSKLFTNGNSNASLIAAQNGSPSRQPKRQRFSSNATSDTTAESELCSRAIVALDLDAFYVSACRKRDPSLIGIPIGIQQKALVATISYEARAAGVGKLDSIKDALKKCPDMVLVNGEDLTYFRQVSAQVWKLVSAVVWEKKVEKLGMDELFCDVTEMVDHHLDSLQKGPQGERWFDLNQPRVGEKLNGYGFAYKAWPAGPSGHIHPSDAAEHLERNCPDRWQERMLVASQLALYLRQRISNEVGLTCSAGIAPSKSLAKLVGALNKPNQQTVFSPPIASLNDTKSDETRLLHYITSFLDPLDLRKLPGFGRVVVSQIREHLQPSPPITSTSSTGRVRVNFMDPVSISDDEAEAKTLKVTVRMARKMLSLDQMVGLFGEVIGPKLWALACGRDLEPVIPAPDFPLQLSIEDTYPYPSLRGAAIQREISRLSLSLLRRLELELTTQPSTSRAKPTPLSQETTIKSEKIMIREYKDPPPEKTRTSGWLRYPLKLRLSIRLGWNNRVSKQTKMPVEIFEMGESRESRAESIAKACRALLRGLIGGDDVPAGPDGMNLINIAALELSEKRPQRALGSFFSAEGENEKIVTPKGGDRRTGESSAAEAIDKGFLASLPPELREEIAREYGIDLGSSVVTAGSTPYYVESCVPSVQSVPRVKGKGKNIPRASLVCRSCGDEMEVWMQHDHELYPFTGLPALDMPSAALSSPEAFAKSDDNDQDGMEKENDLVKCELCREWLKPFMLVAHKRFHELENEF
ncbi:related to DNA Polymerase iota (POLI) [Melanopsichium pennsylvanicum]|uniref:Related to DNA Polymerase iota (POLI) n=2 Tax=Melanopsichium pennsylvanicum TaxID=63383 RepID=A0AAJ5C3J0_9BASI|nr:related to DNA Polymerase iota (POLI) [Melanopsichium pennsylvanicum 4]SNX82681.1 related to DNA Polymerase iota (POLI) [Melanopsichium pennsylvanicum]